MKILQCAALIALVLAQFGCDKESVAGNHSSREVVKEAPALASSSTALHDAASNRGAATTETNVQPPTMKFQTNLSAMKEYGRATESSLNDARISGSFEAVIGRAMSLASKVLDHLGRARESAREFSGKDFAVITLPDGVEITYVFSRTNAVLFLTQVKARAKTGERTTIIFDDKGGIKSVFSAEEGVQFFPDGRPKSFFGKSGGNSVEAEWDRGGRVSSAHVNASQ
jgi:hypothetical protein